MKKISEVALVSIVAVIMLCPAALAMGWARPMISAHAPDQTAEHQVTENDRLAVAPETVNADRPQVYVTAGGKIISPMPSDPARLPAWQATQVWLSENVGDLQRLMTVWQSQVRGPQTAYLNERLQEHLLAVGLTDEVHAVNERVLADVTAGRPQTTAVAGCGPKGKPADQVMCCVQVCDQTGCYPMVCKLCDCDPDGLGCCIYAPTITPVE